MKEKFSFLIIVFSLLSPTLGFSEEEKALEIKEINIESALELGSIPSYDKEKVKEIALADFPNIVDKMIFGFDEETKIFKYANLPGTVYGAVKRINGEDFLIITAYSSFSLVNFSKNRTILKTYGLPPNFVSYDENSPTYIEKTSSLGNSSLCDMTGKELIASFPGNITFIGPNKAKTADIFRAPFGAMTTVTTYHLDTGAVFEEQTIVDYLDDRSPVTTTKRVK